jgi:hypothetical protein
MIAGVIFGLFLCFVVFGVYWLLKSDTNEPDTELTLAIMRLKVKIPQMGLSFAQATKAMQEVNESFRKFGIAISKVGK